MEVNEEDRIADKGDDAEQESRPDVPVEAAYVHDKKILPTVRFWSRSNGITNGSLL